MSKTQIEIGDGWNQFKGQSWPEQADPFADKHDVFKWGGECLAIYYKGETMETATDWILILDDGGFYKVGAEYMIWSNDYCIAAWSGQHVVDTATAIMAGQKPVRDPQYQT